MIIEKLNILCAQNGISLTALCKEITGSSGNLPTWKKDRIRSDWLKEICLKFNISSDFLLDLSCSSNNSNDIPPSLSQDEKNVLLRFKRLNPDYQIKAQSYMVDLYEKQESINPSGGKTDMQKNTIDYSSVAADEPLKKTGTTNLAK